MGVERKAAGMKIMKMVKIIMAHAHRGYMAKALKKYASMAVSMREW